MAEEPKLIVVGAFSHAHEAHLACSALRAAGLEPVIADANIVATDWLLSNAVGGVKILVPAEDAPAAREVLEKAAVLETDATAEAAAADERPIGSRCPRCGSTDVAPIRRGKRMAILSWLAAGVPLFPVLQRRRCRNCGRVFR